MHQPTRGEIWGRPRVHRGFQRCWLANGFNLRVRDHIRFLLDSGALEQGNIKLYVTGVLHWDAVHQSGVCSCKCVWLFVRRHTAWHTSGLDDGRLPLLLTLALPIPDRPCSTFESDPEPAGSFFTDSANAAICGLS